MQQQQHSLRPGGVNPPLTLQQQRGGSTPPGKIRGYRGMWWGDRTLAHFCQAGFAFIFFHLSSFLSCGEISSCFSHFFWFLSTVPPLQETKPILMWTGLSPIFCSNFFTHFVLCGHFPSDRPSLPRRNSRQFFIRRFGSHLVLCGRFPSDRSSLPRQNSRQFFRSMFFSHSVL